MNNPSTVRILRLPTVIQNWYGKGNNLRLVEPQITALRRFLPQKRMLGVKSVGWVESEIDEWLLQRSKLI